MVVHANLQFLGTTVVQGKKDPTRFYNTISFLDGLESVNIMTDDAILFDSMVGLPQLTPVSCEIHLNTQYGSLKLLKASLISDTPAPATDTPAPEKPKH